ncbi:hypothetical protein QJS10_CPB19g00374 [Acorus calamus]|uniref:DDE Tnp4 domain-containing protein n=1 Tax=Acorus calamus TaxID=4465 RepID=A0AAV9CEP6_ACOCL|nr:hypothetical protein QJS10_CPB19g00374 [Acorus calamus]
MRFQYVLTGWESSASDSKILYHALSMQGDPLQIHEGAGYPNMKGFVAPFGGVHYHLKEFSSGTHRIQTKKELFNRRHLQLRNVVERTFGLLKARFPILQHPMRYPFDSQINSYLDTRDEIQEAHMRFPKMYQWDQGKDDEEKLLVREMKCLPCRDANDGSIGFSDRIFMGEIEKGVYTEGELVLIGIWLDSS